MLGFFKPITYAESLVQQQHFLEQSATAATEHTAAAAQKQLLKPGPGRPRKQLNAYAILNAAAAVEEPSPAPPAKRTKYTNWFASPLIHDIIAAYAACSGSARRTVEWLQRRYPKLGTETEGRFAHLSESSLRTWFDADHQLLPKYKCLLEQNLHCPQRGVGRPSALSEYPDIEEEAKRILGIIRQRGGTVNTLVVRIVMRTVISARQPDLLADLQLSQSWCSVWVRTHMNMTWRTRTSAASKLPPDWQHQGMMAAKRIAYNMQLYKIHPSLVVNPDQTGLNLVPADKSTYEQRGAKAVHVIGAEDKRQITCVVSSSLDGDLLPLQLIFQGKTDACHPSHTDASRRARVHITHSPNHWSNQETMRQWIHEVLLPYADRKIVQHSLPRDSHIVLVLDVWSVHVSEEFRTFLRTYHPNIHLVFVPPNCTSKLQVADVILQRPFKCGIRRQFTSWATEILQEQIAKNEIYGLTPYLKMSVIKPNILQWCVESWSKLKEATGRQYIVFGWRTCCTSLYDVHSVPKRVMAVEEVARGEYEGVFVPERKKGTEVAVEDREADQSDASDEDTDEEKDELDVMKARVYGERKSTRKRTHFSAGSYMFNSQQIALSEDSEA
jgi:DDE superfamily endonuclease